ncbi:ParB/Srx family N-terminal domain-containing protein [Bradyrhizobium neotropicale]|uniref:ParB/Srx family N-terminal domain-containing protein n=1 Tax=Bradyrhizobium neotropicale TaxID=1497615 RepID=UPI001AD7AFC7|nr:ParB/Srx family N-terminal domain-containing protein [Bradyrhizobium neotropicale]MBO4221985.1 ParB N-terminal domain-containing protein [Bradyrhizobium neotropicale]
MARGNGQMNGGPSEDVAGGHQVNGVRWVADQVERWAIARLVPYARNARVHSAQQVGRIAESMKRWGVTMPVLVDEAGEIIAGHGRVMAALKLGYAELPVLVARGWSDEDKKAYRIADNRLGELSTWDNELLALELSDLKAVSFDLGLVGYSANELTELLLPEQVLDDDAGSALLELVDVTIDEPRHQLERGDHYVLADRHHLLCASVISDWSKWSKLLTDGALFCPYPGVFVPFSAKAVRHALVMVQPDPYIAGHILDRFEDAKAGEIRKQ